TAASRVGDLVVAALVAVNAAGAPGADDALATGIAAAAAPAGRGDADAPGAPGGPWSAGLAGMGNTTIGLMATNARLDKLGCHIVAQGAHDGLARAVFPAHGRSDG